MSDTFKPAQMSAMVSQLVHRGQYLGSRGAIGRALKAHLRPAREGSPSDAMVLANVFYSAAGNMAVSGILYKLLAPLFLFLAKWSVTKAFTSQGKVPSLLGSLSVIETSLRTGAVSYLGYGDIQILQSTFFQWRALKRMFNLDTTKEEVVMKECGRVIRHSENKPLHVLSSCIFFQMHERYSVQSLMEWEFIHEFIRRNYRKAMTAGVPNDVAQVLCRAARTIGSHTIAKEIAAKYHLNDQLQKVGK